MAASNTRDVLIAEMLGDIGKLLDQVARLKTELPSILGQMQTVIAEQKAVANVLQEPTQRAIQTFIWQELRGIRVAVKEAQAAAINSLNGDVTCAIRKNLSWAQVKSQQSFDAAADHCMKSFEVTAAKFDTAVTASAKLAENRATETLKNLCQVLKNRTDEIRAERWRGQFLSMLGACVGTGLVVGVCAVYILK